MSFKTVFDVTNSGYDWLLPVYGAFFVALGLILVFKPDALSRLTLGRTKPPKSRWFPLAFLFLALAVDVSAFSITFSRYQHVREIMREHRYRTVEGRVTNFVPMPVMGHAMESFAVNGQSFSYSDFVATPGFHNTTSHGGPIHEGLYVRVAYVGNDILRLEIAQ